MDIILVTLLIVIYYKARKGIEEKGLIKAAKIIGYPYLSISLVTGIVGIIVIPEMRVRLGISIAVSIILMIIVIRVNKIVKNTMYRDDEWR